MDAIKDIIPRVIAPLADGKSNSADVARAWQMLGEEVKKSSAQAFKDGCLIVHVDSAARVVRMNLNKQSYLKALNAKKLNIKDIRFKVGKI
jgi:hypothetical protein